MLFCCKTVLQKSLIYPLIIFLTCSCTSSDLTIKSSLSIGILHLDIIAMVWCKFNCLSDFKNIFFPIEVIVCSLSRSEHGTKALNTGNL